MTTVYPKNINIFDSFDDKGQILSTERLLGEKNWEYRRRLRTVFTQQANAAYRGLVNGTTRELGLSLFDAISIDPKMDTLGHFIAPDPYVKFEGPHLYLYSDYANDLLDYKIDRMAPGGNYEALSSLISFINTTPFFQAGLCSNTDDTNRSMTILNQTNRNETTEIISCSTKFKLSYERIINGSLFFSDRHIFQTEVASELLVNSIGKYWVDYVNGIVRVYSAPRSKTQARYEYTVFPFIAIASPVVLHNITSEDFKVKLFDQVIQDDGTYAHQLPTALGVDIINELLSIGNGLYNGK